MIETYETIEQQWCYVTLTTVENVDMFSTGIIQIHEMLLYFD